MSPPPQGWPNQRQRLQNVRTSVAWRPQSHLVPTCLLHPPGGTPGAYNDAQILLPQAGAVPSAITALSKFGVGPSCCPQICSCLFGFG